MEALVFEAVSIQEAKAVLDEVGSAPVPVDWERLRAPQIADLKLAAPTFKWLAVLPAEIRPLALCASYARIGNRLAVLWDDLGARGAYLDDLALDTRGGRQGFPPAIALEIAALRAYHLEQSPAGTDIWALGY